MQQIRCNIYNYFLVMCVKSRRLATGRIVNLYPIFIFQVMTVGGSSHQIDVFTNFSYRAFSLSFWANTQTLLWIWMEFCDILDVWFTKMQLNNDFFYIINYFGYCSLFLEVCVLTFYLRLNNAWHLERHTLKVHFVGVFCTTLIVLHLYNIIFVNDNKHKLVLYVITVEML